MKVVILLCLVVVTFIGLANAHFPDDMPESLKQEATSVHDAIHTWREQNPNDGWDKIPADLKQKMDDLKAKYEAATGKEWPKYHGHKHN
uniref:CSON013139 protein n=1 Tax=Culicoides sonorensis TaxID=179676 RepID=A0A336M7Z4_CULSO